MTFIEALKKARPLVEKHEYICVALRYTLRSLLEYEEIRGFQLEVETRIFPNCSVGGYLVESNILPDDHKMAEQLPYRLLFIDHMIAGLPGLPDFASLKEKLNA